MGCTASAPNTISVNGNATENNEQLIEETLQVPEPAAPGAAAAAADVDTNELPTSCDTVVELVQSSLTQSQSKASLLSDKEIQVDGHVNEIDPDPDKNEQTEAKTEQTADVDKIPKLEKLIDKVFEINPKLIDIPPEPEGDPEQAPSKEDGKEDNTEDKETDNLEEQSEANEDDSNDKPDDEMSDSEVNPEDASPTTSEFGHATRWEALADIVAELPPSLAIDPITGQIYSLTK